MVTPCVAARQTCFHSRGIEDERCLRLAGLHALKGLILVNGVAYALCVCQRFGRDVQMGPQDQVL